LEKSSPPTWSQTRKAAITFDSAGDVLVSGTAKDAELYGSTDLYFVKYRGPKWRTDLGEAIRLNHGEDFGIAVGINSGGEVVVIGDSKNYGLTILKLSSSDGIIILAAGPFDGLHPASMALDPSGGVIVTGAKDHSGDTDLFTAKFAGSTGYLLWQQTYNTPGRFSSGGLGDDAGSAVILDHVGNVIVTGFTPVEQHDGTDIYTAKYSSIDGHLLWEKLYDGTGIQHPGAGEKRR
jgi:hypothetical protein